MKLNLGCGGYPLAGYTNVDLHPPADIVGDFTMMSFAEVSEVRMSHVLEHISWRRTPGVLACVRSWMVGGALLIVEVPDMAALCEIGPSYPAWQQWIFGEQSHAGERHLAGFTLDSLSDRVGDAGFKRVTGRRFVSDHPMRNGYPCIEVTGAA